MFFIYCNLIDLLDILFKYDIIILYALYIAQLSW